MDDIPKDPNVLKPAVTTPLEPVSPNSGWVKEEPPPTPDVPPVHNPPKEIFSPLTESRPDQPTLTSESWVIFPDTNSNPSAFRRPWI